mmetsp:Transcript_13778/g.32058  ORF Transcript_13778/g.32058 Transcript_13778/m.32058 type:complete len:205 (+) Transcript_13778:718-1332(+)
MSMAVKNASLRSFAVAVFEEQAAMTKLKDAVLGCGNGGASPPFSPSILCSSDRDRSTLLGISSLVASSSTSFRCLDQASNTTLQCLRLTWDPAVAIMCSRISSTRSATYRSSYFFRLPLRRVHANKAEKKQAPLGRNSSSPVSCAMDSNKYKSASARRALSGCLLHAQAWMVVEKLITFGFASDSSCSSICLRMDSARSAASSL